MKTPNPGSPEAYKEGCTCPILDNAHGDGYMGMPGVFVFSEGCSLHSKEMGLAEEKIDEKLNESKD